ncbi:MAG: DUF1573 domain-containing protein [Clostridium sp.]|nr:DUF1573 domain-containing protein [Prevotella sp.]MCM1429031.1 DUF1573 domain-containing protein [Clostridium sp.]MCM1475438.1 DUF1573 domain-containing protein [Muribaculaceae bacterium]
MKKIHCLIMTILLGISPMVLLSQDHGATLRLKEPTIDVGTISGDSIVSVIFTLYNAGDEPGTILKIFSSCSCAVADYSHDPIAPGDSIQFEVRYDPRSYRWGRFRRTLKVRTSGNNPVQSAIIVGEIERKYRK